VDAPQVHYAKSGDVHIAYQVIGSGAVDLVFIPGLFSNLDHNWEEPGFAAFLRRLAAFSRLIVVDPRGTGLTDRAQRHPPMEEQVDDLLSVLDAAGSRSAAFFGFSQAGPIALLFAATHPERTRALVLYATYATPAWHGDYPWGRSAEWLDEFDRRIEREWGTGFFLPQIAPSRVDDPAFSHVVGSDGAPVLWTRQRPGVLPRLLPDRPALDLSVHPRADAGPAARCGRLPRSRALAVPGRSHPRREARGALPELLQVGDVFVHLAELHSGSPHSLLRLPARFRAM
jgi:pimeloyl-ACP methyl ester carboxylesterase